MWMIDSYFEIELYVSGSNLIVKVFVCDFGIVGCIFISTLYGSVDAQNRRGRGRSKVLHQNTSK